MYIILRSVKIIVLLYSFFCYLAYGSVLLNSSYDVSRELFSEINSKFIKYWNNINPQDKLIIRQSHAGSTRQAIAILQGLRADVVTYNQVIDIQILYDHGKLIDKDWRDRLPNYSSPYFSTMAFIVRKGNPKKIYTWFDLTHEGLEIVLPNPKTSGNGRYAYLAAWIVFFKNSLGDINKTRTLMQSFLKNVIVFDTGGRLATATFVDRNQGDVLINFESEAKLIQNQYGCDNYEVIIPKLNILAEFPVTWIDKNVFKNRTEEIAKTYLSYLYTLEAQRIIVKFGYRVNSNDIMKESLHIFPEVQLFKVEDQCGDWHAIMKKHFSRGGELDRLLFLGHRY